MDEPSVRPFAIILMRVLTGSIVFTGIYFLFIREKIDWRDIPLFIGCGLTGIAINMSFFFIGLNYTTPIHASLVMTATPVLVMLLSFFILKEHISKINALGIILALAGAILLIYKPGMGFSSTSSKGDFFIFLNGTSYAIYLVIVKNLIKKYSPFTILMMVFSIGSLFVFPFGINAIMLVEWVQLSNAGYYAIIYVLVATTCMAYLFNAFALNHLKSSTVGSYIYLQPILATFIAVLWKKDFLTLKILLCSILIFIGLYLVSKKNKKI